MNNIPQLFCESAPTRSQRCAKACSTAATLCLCALYLHGAHIWQCWELEKGSVGQKNRGEGPGLIGGGPDLVRTSTAPWLSCAAAALCPC